MSNSALTVDGANLIAYCQANQILMPIDKIIFADIVGLDVESQPDPSGILPDPAEIVHTSDNLSAGLADENTVIYSAILGADIGDFHINWMGLYSTVHDTIVAVCIMPRHYKYDTDGFKLGNTFYKNFALQITNIADLTGIIISAETWQFECKRNGVFDVIIQPNHGFSPGNIIYFNGVIFIKAKADDISTIGRLLVIAVIDDDTFRVSQSALNLEIEDATFASKVSPGKFYMTSKVDAGEFIDTTDVLADDYEIRNTLFTVRGKTANSANIDILPWRVGSENVTPSFSLIYSAGANGSITGTSPQNVLQGESGTPVTAVPDAGYSFINWSDGNTSQQRTDINVQANINVIANFAIVPIYTLTYNAGANGSITGTSPQNVLQGNDGSSVTAVPDTGYSFVDWSDGNTDNPRTDTNVQNNITVTATFSQDDFTVTYNAGANGTISGTSPQQIAPGGSTSAVTAVPNATYDFVDWSDGVTDNPRTDTNVQANITVTANFALKLFRDVKHGGGRAAKPYNAQVFINKNGDAVVFGTLPTSGGIYYLGDTASHIGPVVVPHHTTEANDPNSKIIKLIMAGTDMFILYNNGNLYVRGLNAYGTLGLGHTNIVSDTTLSATNVLDVECASINHAYFNRTAAMIIKTVGSENKVFSAGFNDAGQLGTGVVAHVNTWTDVTPAGVNVAAIYPLTNSFAHSAIITTEGDVYTCGDNAVGQLGDATTTNSLSFIKMLLQAGQKAIQIALNYHSTGEGNTFILTETGNIYGCGEDGNHDFANGITTIQSTPVLMYDGHATKAVEILCNINGDATLIFKDENGDAYSIGHNNDGQCGIGSIIDQNVFNQILAISNVKDLFVVNHHATVNDATFMAITTDNKMYTWGEGATRCIGDGGTTQRTTPVEITSIVQALMNISDISIIKSNEDAGNHSWMLQEKEDASNEYGTIFGWGDNGSKTLDDSTNNYSSIIEVYNI